MTIQPIGEFATLGDVADAVEAGRIPANAVVRVGQETLTASEAVRAVAVATPRGSEQAGAAEAATAAATATPQAGAESVSTSDLIRATATAIPRSANEAADAVESAQAAATAVPQATRPTTSSSETAAATAAAVPRVASESVVTSALSWTSASDWDNAVSESGVVHENVTNTDYTDASTIRIGYSAVSPFDAANLWGFWPMHEDSGSTVYDFSGNNRDGAVTGATANASGVVDTTAWDYDGGDDETEYANPSQTSFSAAVWVNADTLPSSVSDNYRVLSCFTGDTQGWGIFLHKETDEIRVDIQDGSTTVRLSGHGRTVNTGTWEFIVVTYDGSTVTLYVNGIQIDSASAGYQPPDTEVLHTGGSPHTTGEHYDGQMSFAYLATTGWSSSQQQTLYDVIDTESNLETATKSFASSATPDLQGLSYSLNGQSITVDVIGSPGTASEEVVSQTLDGASSYSLTWSNSHTDFRLKPRLSTSDPTTTPTFSQAELA